MSNGLIPSFARAFIEIATQIAIDAGKDAAIQVLTPELEKMFNGRTDAEVAKIIDGMREAVLMAVKLRDVPSVVHAAERLGYAIPHALTETKHAHLYGEKDLVTEYGARFYPDSAFLKEK